MPVFPPLHVAQHEGKALHFRQIIDIDKECDIPVLSGALTTQLSVGRFHNSMLGPHAYEVF